MRTIEEILNSLSENPKTTNEVIWIDADYRKVDVPSNEKVFGVVGDGDAERKYLACKRKPSEDFDFDKAKIRIYFKSVAEDETEHTDTYLVDEKLCNEDYVVFSWLLGPSVFPYKGKIYFFVRAEIEAEQRVWQTDIATGIIHENFTITLTEPEENMIRDFAKEIMDEIEKKGEYVLSRLPEDYIKLAEHHDIETQAQLDAIINAIFSEHVAGPDGNILSYDDLVLIMKNYLKNEAKGNILKIGGLLQLANGDILYTEDKSIDWAVNNVANYILNKIKGIEGIKKMTGSQLGGAYAKPATASDTQEVHITPDGFLVTQKSSGGGGSFEYYSAESNGITTDEDDNTDKLQELIDSVSANGGGTILFGGGIYKFNSGLLLKPGVSLKGSGIGATTLLYNGDDKFITVSIESTWNDIEDITLCGTQEDWINEPGSIASATNVSFGPNGTHGIYFEVDPNTLKMDYNHTYYNNKDNATTANAYVHQSNRSSNRWIALKDTEKTRETIHQWSWENAQGVHANTQIKREYPMAYDKFTYKNTLIRNVCIIGFTGYGLFQSGDNYGVYLSWVTVLNCGCGIYYGGSDTMCNNLTIEGCAYEGVIFHCANMKVSAVKCIWNGMAHNATNYSDDSPFLTALNMGDINKKCTAAILAGHRNTYFGIEVQDNANLIAFQICGNNISAYGLLADGNNYLPGVGTLSNSVAVNINGCHDSKIDIAIANYNYEKPSTTPLYMSNSDYAEVVYSMANYNKNIVAVDGQKLFTKGNAVNNCIVRRAGTTTNLA